MKSTFQLILLVCAICCTTLVSNAQIIDASFTPSKTSGVAPLAVFFDATATTISTDQNTFHDLCYSWDFGDDNGDIWTHSDKSKNTDTGPLAGHLFKTPGTYIVTLTAKDNLGNLSNNTTTIIVDDPEVVFANSTTYFSNTNDFSGVPEGATTSATTDIQDVIDAVSEGRRALLKRGETWEINGTGYKIGDTDIGYLGAWGASTQPDPILNVSATTGEIFRLRNTSNVVIRDLDLRGNGAIAFTTSYHKLLSDITFHNVKMDNFHSGIIFSAFHLIEGDPIFPRTSIIECSVTNVTGPASGGSGMFLAGEELLWMGNVIDDTSQSEHCLRITSLVNGVISHNYIAKPSTHKHHIKLHGGSFTGGGAEATRNRYTEFFIISNNVIVADTNPWHITVGPQSTGDERVREGIVEKNIFKKGTNPYQSPLIVNAQGITIRNNLFIMNSGAAAVNIFKRGDEPVPSNIQLYNNTVVSTENTTTLQLISLDAEATDIIHNNNVVYGPEANSVRICANNAMGSTEYASTIDPGFFDNNFNLPTSFQLNSSSPLIGAGSLVPVCDDFFDNPRTSPYDIGAHGFSGIVNIDETSMIPESTINFYNTNEEIIFSMPEVGHSGAYNLSIFNLKGELLQHDKFYLNNGEIEKRMPLSNSLGNGFYVFELSNIELNKHVSDKLVILNK